MKYALIKNNEAIHVHGAFTDNDGVQHPANVLNLWSEEDLLGIGVHKIIIPDNPDAVIVTGSHLEINDGCVHLVYETKPYDLDVERVNKKHQIDSSAEIERQKYLTPGMGQAMTYQAKTAEAIRYHETNGQGDYPFLSEEVGVTGDTLADVAATVLTMHHEWQIIGAQIERERLSAKRAVEAATTVTELNNIKPVWP